MELTSALSGLVPQSFFVYLKRFFLYFGKGIFRTLVYSEPETYSEQYQTPTMERFAKIATWRTFLYFDKKNFLPFPSPKNGKSPLLKNFLYFGKRSFLAPSLKNFSYFRTNYLNQSFLPSLEKNNSLSKETFLILTQKNWFFTIQKISYALSITLLFCVSKVQP